MAGGSKFQKLFQDFSSAIKRFEEVLAQEKNEFIRDSAIQRFEFTIELAWKTIKAYLEDYEKIICNSPRSCFKEAYKIQLIEYEPGWLSALELRNRIAHVYNEKMAEDLYQKLPEILPLFKKLEENLKKEIN